MWAKTKTCDDQIEFKFNVYVKTCRIPTPPTLPITNRCLTGRAHSGLSEQVSFTTFSSSSCFVT